MVVTIPQGYERLLGLGVSWKGRLPYHIGLWRQDHPTERYGGEWGLREWWGGIGGKLTIKKERLRVCWCVCVSVSVSDRE